MYLSERHVICLGRGLFNSVLRRRKIYNSTAQIKHITPSLSTQSSSSSSSSPTTMPHSDANHTKSGAPKPATAVSTITDPNFLPSLDEAPTTRKLQSHLLLSLLLASAIFAAYILGLDIIQGRVAIGVLGVAVALAIGAVGGWNIDWWELVLGYWWFSIPIAGLAGLAYLIMQEHASGLNETD